MLACLCFLTTITFLIQRFILTEERPRRATCSGTNSNTCSLYLVIDPLFYENVGDSNTMSSVMYVVSSPYSSFVYIYIYIYSTRSLHKNEAKNVSYRAVNFNRNRLLPQASSLQPLHKTT